MSFYTLSAAVNLISSVIIGFFVLFKNSRNPTNRNLSYFCFGVIAWSFGYLFWQLANDYNSAYFWAKFLMVGASFAPLFYLTFVLQFLKLYKKNRLYRAIHWGAYLLTASFILININTNLLVHHLEQRLFFPYWPVGGKIFIPFLGMFFGYLSTASFLLIKSYKKSSGVEKTQIKYIFAGITIAFIGGSTNYFLWFNIPILPIGTIFVTAYPIFIAYAIVKYRLLNIRFIFTRSLVYILLVTFLSLIFVTTSSFAAIFFEQNLSINKYLVWIIFATLVVFGLEPLKSLFAKATDRIFYKDKVDYPKVLKVLSNLINEEIDLENLILHFSGTLTGSLKLKKVQVLLSFEDERAFLPSEYYAQPLAQRSAEYKKSQRLFFDSPFIRHLRTYKEVVVTDELDRYYYDSDDEGEKRRLEKVLRNLEEFHAAVVVPVIREKKMTAILAIGPKVSGETFSTEDINLFEVLSSQFAAALQRSKLYQETQLFNVKLQKEVERATEDLKKVNAQLQEANAHLKHLDEAKSEFMSIASHQLRTPLAGIMGYLSMILSGDYGKIGVEQVPVLKEIFEASQRLIRMVNLFLNVTRIEAGRFVMNFASVPFADVIDAMYKELKPTAEKKNVKLIYEKTTLPNVEVDADKIKDVILNLVDNAIKYTPEGSVTLTAEADTKSVRVHVKDTGVGIDSQEAKNLFAKFVRGSDIARIAPNGSGLGLFIAKKIVEGHGGKIWAESQGANKGTTFSFEIPLKADTNAVKAAAEFQKRAKEKDQVFTKDIPTIASTRAGKK